MKHLVTMFNRADATDRKEGRLAYDRYYRVMMDVADCYLHPVDRVTAAFVAMSPNSDYIGNLRSLISLCDGLEKGVPLNRITVSTYEHCRNRAHEYLTGAKVFLEHVKGLKTRAFYKNIIFPNSFGPVTIDGHMMAIWAGKNMTMKDAKVTPKQYFEISEDISHLAVALGLLPHQLQATLWFTRKRVEKIVYDPQGDLFFGRDDMWKVSQSIHELKPYPIKRAA